MKVIEYKPEFGEYSLPSGLKEALTGKSIEEVTAACERDNFMTSEEAKDFGLIDRVLERH